MIEHIVLLKAKAGVTPEEEKKILTSLVGLKDQVPGVLDPWAGPNFSQRSQGFTHVFYVRFSDRAALQAYLDHPAHQAVVAEVLVPLTETRLIVDVER